MSVWDKLGARAYDNTDPCPVKPRRPRLAPNPTAEQARAYAEALDLYENVELPEHEAAYAAYRARSAELAASFQNDLEDYYNMRGHPKAELLYWKCYERGHHAGFGEIASVYSDLVELVK